MKAYSLFILFFFSTVCAMAQSIGREPANNTLNKHKELASKQLSEEQKLAYTKRAKQKLQDMADYINLIKTSGDMSDKQRALRQLQALFWQAPSWAKTIETVSAYAGKVNIAITNIMTQDNLSQSNNGEYIGKLAYTLAGKQEYLAYTVRKNKKRVGSQDIMIWELFFNP